MWSIPVYIAQISFSGLCAYEFLCIPLICIADWKIDYGSPVAYNLEIYMAEAEKKRRLKHVCHVKLVKLSVRQRFPRVTGCPGVVVVPGLVGWRKQG